MLFMERKGLWGNYIITLNKIPFNFTLCFSLKIALADYKLNPNHDYAFPSEIQRTWVNEAINMFKIVFQKEKWADDGSPKIIVQICFWSRERHIMSSCL